MIAPRTRNGILVLAVLAGGLVWLSQGHRDGGVDGRGDFNSRLDYAVQNFELTVLDENGSLHLLLEAPELVNDAETGIGVVESPRLTMREPGAEWQLVADSATIAADRNHVSLNGGVQVDRSATQERPPFRLRTDSMDVVVSRRVARTRDPVEIVEGSNQLQAVGMRLNLANESLKLFKDVQGVYAVE